MPERDIQQQWNRDDEQKRGRPPRSASEPKGSEGSSRNTKTMTDPASGEPQEGAPAPNASKAADARADKSRGRG